MHVKFSVTAMYIHYNAHNLRWLITLVDIKFIPEIILMDFHWEKVHKLDCMHKMFISPSVFMIPVTWPKTEILG